MRLTVDFQYSAMVSCEMDVFVGPAESGDGCGS
jgi:hypothetical protein